MKVIDIEQLNEIFIKKAAVTVGFFDGMHMGHQKIFQALSKLDDSYSKVVITFDDDLISTFKSQDTISYFDDKLKFFESYNVDYVLVIKKNSEVLKLRAIQFIDKILEEINTNIIICGQDFSIGSDKGSVLTIKNNSNFKVIEIQDYINSLNEKITSTYIRGLLKQGKIEEANAYMFFPFVLKSKVIHGNEIGRKINYQTANIKITKPCYTIKQGVYNGYVKLDNKRYKAMINIGTNPTISKDDTIKVEAFILDLNENIYDKEIAVYPVIYTREEIQFNSIEELKSQLDKDYASLIQFDRGTMI